MRGDAWNHNIHYHEVVLRAIPSGCQRALDVGCGEGRLARQLALQSEEVIAIDTNNPAIRRAGANRGAESRVKFIEADAMTYPFPNESFDVITVVAALHHMPLRPALERFRNLLRPRGVLAIVGLYRSRTFADYAFAAAAIPLSRIMRCMHRYENVAAPLQDPSETLHEIRTASRELLPGSVLKRHVLFRYSLIWSKP